MASRVVAVLKEHVLVFGAAVILAVGATVYVSWNGNGASGDTYTVVRGDLEQVVSFSGTVAPRVRADLAFERAGRVTRVSYDTGDFVAAGATIAVLDSGSVEADLARERALLASEEAALAQLVRGTREEALALERARVAQNEASLAQSETALTTALANSYTTADTSIERLVDDLFTDPTTQPRVKYATTDRSLELRIENERLQLENMLDEWRQDVRSISRSDANERSGTVALLERFRDSLVAQVAQTLTTQDAAEFSLTNEAQEARERLLRMRTFMADISAYTNDLVTQPTLTQATIDAWRAQAATERANIAQALTALNTAQQNYTAAQSALSVSERQLTLSEAGATVEDIAAQEARVAAQEARVRSLTSELGKFAIRAPRSGILTTRDIDPGELASVGVPVLTIDSTDSTEVEARISELDIILLEENMEATVTTDAFGDATTFAAVLTDIDPAETVVNSVAGYGVTLLIDDERDMLKAGMTANVVIAFITEADTLIVPVGFVERTAQGAFVTVLADGVRTKTRVALGAQTTDGRIAVREGISEGDILVAYEAGN